MHGGTGLSGITKTHKKPGLEVVLLEAQKELESLRSEVERYKLVFDSARMLIGHEYIKPLTAISGYMELLEAELGEDLVGKGQRYMGKVREAVARFEELIDTTVQMLRMGTRVEKIYTLELVDARELVERVRSRFGDRVGRVRNLVPADLGKLPLRRRGMEIVIENIVSNALKHTGDACDVKVNASLIRNRRAGSDGKLLLVKIADEGEGIPKDELKKIFDPFYRRERPASQEGIGLGLALVKSVIAIMNGDISIDSSVGEGTTVTFTVPVGEGVYEVPEIIG
jgi:signal transduction histidine kinase